MIIIKLLYDHPYFSCLCEFGALHTFLCCVFVFRDFVHLFVYQLRNFSTNNAYSYHFRRNTLNFLPLKFPMLFCCWFPSTFLPLIFFALNHYRNLVIFFVCFHLYSIKSCVRFFINDWVALWKTNSMVLKSVKFNFILTTIVLLCCWKDCR